MGYFKTLRIDVLNKEMERLGIDGLNAENVGVIVDFGSESEDEHECDRKAIEKEDEEIRDFVKCHPMPSPDDEEGEQFWKKVIDRLKNDQGINALTIYSFVNFDIIKRMYENLTD